MLSKLLLFCIWFNIYGPYNIKATINQWHGQSDIESKGPNDLRFKHRRVDSYETHATGFNPYWNMSTHAKGLLTTRATGFNPYWNMSTHAKGLLTTRATGFNPYWNITQYATGFNPYWNITRATGFNPYWNMSTHAKGLLTTRATGFNPYWNITQYATGFNPYWNITRATGFNPNWNMTTHAKGLLTPGIDSDFNKAENSESEGGFLDNKHKLSYERNCWLEIKPGTVFDQLENLDKSYQKVRNEFQDAVGMDKFDKEMLKTILLFQGKAYRAIHNFGGIGTLIPAGLNLGGYAMMRMPESILFFHRMKLRNDTRFKIDLLKNDLTDMTLTVRLSLNDLHLRGSYERSITDSRNPSVIFYKPTFGNVDLLLRNGKYKVEGRYRMLQDRLLIQHIISDISVDDVVATYSNDISKTMPIRFDKRLIDEFVHRMKLDLDHWLKDYFNDYLTLFEVNGGQSRADYQNYDKKKAVIANAFVESTIDKLKTRLRQLRAISLKAPDFTIHSNKDTTIIIKNGVIRGLESMSRRSVATTLKKGALRYIDATIIFSKLKIEYQYEAQMTLGTPTLNGMIVMNMDGFSAHMGLTIVREPEAFDLHVEFFEQTKPESLVIEGPLNRRLSNFKHIVESQIVSLLSNAVIHEIKMLSYLSHCKKAIPGHMDPNEIFDEKKVTQSYDRVTNPYPDGDDDDDNDVTQKPDSGSDDNDETVLPPDSGSDNNDVTKPCTGSGDNDSDNKDLTVPPPDSDCDNNDFTSPMPDSDSDNKDLTVPPPDSDSDNNDFTSPMPDSDSDNKDLTVPPPDSDSDNNDETVPPPDSGSDDNGKPTPPPNSGSDTNKAKGDYGIDRSESIEFILPKGDGQSQDKKMHLKYKETAVLSEIKNRRKH